MDAQIIAIREAFSVPFNIFLLILMFVMLIFWWSANKWQTPDRVRRRAIFFSPQPTQFLQKRLRSNPIITKILDFVTIQVWFWVFGVSIVIEWYICALQGKDAWRFGCAVLLAWGTSMTIQFLFPVIVPIRWDKFGRDLQVVPIRLLKFPQSDNVNGLLYNGLPSNHLGMMLAGAILSLFSVLKYPWWGWYGILFFFLGIAAFFCFSVIYLGEHYFQDLIASFLVYPPIMFSVYFILNLFVPMT